MLPIGVRVKRIVSGVLGLSAVVCASQAWASPWTLPKDELSFSAYHDFQTATQEYRGDGTRQEFPLDGQFYGNTLAMGARYGFTPRLELEIDAHFKAVSYVSEPVIIALPEDSADLQTARDSILNFTQAELGLGDVYLAARYNLARNRVGAITSETRFKLPTGYKAPGQTFRDNTPSDDGIDDDVTLGDGQMDIEQSLLFGVYAPATRTFGRAGVGVRLRMGAPGHQAIADAKVGQYLGQSLMVFAGVRGALTVVEGDSLGLTYVTTRNNVTPDNIRLTDIKTDELFLDKDFVQTEAGLLLFLTDLVELQAAYSYIPVGKNISTIHSFSLGTTIRIPELTAH